MRILHTVEFYEPVRGGAQEVVRQISEGLAARGHEVTVATSFVPGRRFHQFNGVAIEDFQIGGNATLGIRGERHRYQAFLRDTQFDVMMNYAAQTWTTDLALPLLDDIPCTKVLVPCGYSALRKWWLRLLYAPYFRRLPRYLARYDRVVYHSPLAADKAFGDRHQIAHTAVIPNGAAWSEFAQETRGFRQACGLQDGCLILNVSNHYRIKGHEALYAVLEEAPEPQARLVVIGDEPPAGWSCFRRCEARARRSGGRIQLLCGVPRHMVVSAFSEADLFVMSSEVECFPLVILEAMAAGTPWISLPVGNVRELQGGIVVHSRSELAGAIRFLLNDPAARQALGQQGRRSWEQTYTWERIVDVYESLYQGLVGERSVLLQSAGG